MNYITVGTEKGQAIKIYYKDCGKGQPIMFSHGWPLSADDGDSQMLFVLKHGRGGMVGRESRSRHVAGGESCPREQDV